LDQRTTNKAAQQMPEARGQRAATSSSYSGTTDTHQQTGDRGGDDGTTQCIPRDTSHFYKCSFVVFLCLLFILSKQYMTF
jgi:hypothetical protein